MRLRYILCTSCPLLYVSSNFIHMNHGTLYMVSVRHIQPPVVQAFIYSVNTILVQTADVVSIMSQGPSILAE